MIKETRQPLYNLILSFLFVLLSFPSIARDNKSKANEIRGFGKGLVMKCCPASEEQDSIHRWHYIASFPTKKITRPLVPKDSITLNVSVDAFETWLNKKLKTSNFLKSEIDSLSFILDVSGKVKDVQFFPSDYPNKEGIEKILKKMPKWKPAEIEKWKRTEMKVLVYESTPAQFPGGDAECLKFLAKHIKYPRACFEQGIQGRVLVGFVIDKDGSITDVKVIDSPSNLLSEEALRVVSLMPKWEPATEVKKPVKHRFRLPVIFRIR